MDAEMMSLAIQLAKQGQFTTTPNPNVGCVITDQNGSIVGQGWHQQAGTPHAEIHALRQAADKTKGATAYVTLEPCSHFGKTPPCADALLDAGIKRVVAAMRDPNPLVAGRGLKKLAENGVEVSVGLLETQAQQLNVGFVKRMQQGMPFVQLKLAGSIDGKTALANGQSQWITGPAARRDVQRHRAQSCAILSGSGTVLADDPALNVRFNEITDWQLSEGLCERQPLRVILDGQNRLTPARKLFALDGEVLVVNAEANALLADAGIVQWQAPLKNKKLDLTAVMQHLAELQINHVWVEAGAKLSGALLQAKLVDELILYQAPKIMGDKARNLFEIDEITSMNRLYQLTWADVRQIGPDIKLTAQITYPE